MKRSLGLLLVLSSFTVGLLLAPEKAPPYISSSTPAHADREQSRACGAKCDATARACVSRCGPDDGEHVTPCQYQCAVEQQKCREGCIANYGDPRNTTLPNGDAVPMLWTDRSENWFNANCQGRPDCQTCRGKALAMCEADCEKASGNSCEGNCKSAIPQCR